MLREIYFQLGMTGTLLAGAVVLLTAMTWFVAVAGTVVRPMPRGYRALLLGLLAVAPPAAPIVLCRFIAGSRAEMRRVSRSVPLAGAESLRIIRAAESPAGLAA